jgi:exopolysaccharide biosynthesis polyprenyl glycosylphosphotransferase
MLPKSISYNLWKTAVLPIIDFFSIVVGAGLVYLVRYRWYNESFFDNTNVLRSGNYINFSLVLAFLMIIIFTFLGLYEINSKKNKNFFSVFSRLVFGVLVVLLGVITYYFFNEYNRGFLPNRVSISRFILATSGLFILYFVCVGRLIIWGLEQIFYKLGIGLQDVILICQEPKTMIGWLSKRSDIGKIHHFSKLNQQTYLQIEQMIKSKEISEIYIFSNANVLESRIALIAERYKILFAFRPVDFGQYSAFSMKPISFGDFVLLEVFHTNLEGWLVVLKRIFDIIFAFIFLFSFSWLYLLIIIAIKLDSKGSAFYFNQRVGPNGEVFKLWKFRRFKQEYCTGQNNKAAQEFEADLIAKNNMKQENDPLYKISNDPRMTRVGKILEKTSLDELPQFINVLFGQMSIVGPRPHQPREVKKYKDEHYKVLNIKPGITGLSQTNGRSDLDFETEVFYDKYYLEHWSFWLDIWIILKTPFVILFKPQKS